MDKSYFSRPPVRLTALILWLIFSSVLVLSRSSEPASAGATATPAPSTNSSSPFGITYAAAHPPSYLTTDFVGWTMNEASELGAKSIRWHIPWQTIEIREGRLDWSVSDRIVEAARASNIELVWLLAGYSPGPGQTNFRNLYADSGDQKLDAYASFLHELVGRYQGRVHYWQIENEVALGGDWGSSLEDYITVLSTAYRTIKSEDPDSTVLMAGLAGIGDEAQTRFLLERGRDYFDVLDAHFYQAPEGLPGRIGVLQTEMKRNGYDKPIWVTETGGPHPCTIQSAQEPPPETQSGEVVKRYAELLSAGVERVFWFGLQRDTPRAPWGCRTAMGEPGFDFMMLVRDQDRRLAFSTYQLMVRKLGGFTAVERLTLGEGVSAFRLAKPTGAVFVLWADKDRVVKLGGTAGSVVVTDVSGVARRVDPAAMPLTTSPVFVEDTR